MNKAWEKSFARVNKNRMAIAERGWGPYNRALVLYHPDIRATMTKTEVDAEKALLEAPNDSPSTTLSGETTESSLPSPISLDSCISRSYKHEKLNFSRGMALHVLKHIVKEADLENAREKIKKEKEDGIREKTTLKGAKRITAVNLVKNGIYNIGKTLKDELLERDLKRIQEAYHKKERQKRRELEAEQKCCAAGLSQTTEQC